MGQNVCCSIVNGDSREVNRWRRSEIIVIDLTCSFYCHCVYRYTGCELSFLEPLHCSWYFVCLHLCV